VGWVGTEIAGHGYVLCCLGGLGVWVKGVLDGFMGVVVLVGPGGRRRKFSWNLIEEKEVVEVKGGEGSEGTALHIAKLTPTTKTTRSDGMFEANVHYLFMNRNFTNILALPLALVPRRRANSSTHCLRPGSQQNEACCALQMSTSVICEWRYRIMYITMSVVPAGGGMY
jgi:hypothetical protein